MAISNINGQGPPVVARPRAAAPPSKSTSQDQLNRKELPAGVRAGPGAAENRAGTVAETAPQPARTMRAGTRLRIDEASKRIVAQIMDENNQIIKQIPPEEMLRIAARFREVTGRIFDEKA